MFDYSGTEMFFSFRIQRRKLFLFGVFFFQSNLHSGRRPSAISLEHERKEGISSSNSKQIIYIRADQLLNITLTKTGLDLVQRLSALFNDVYNKRLPMIDDDEQPILSLVNLTGREISIGNFDGVEVRRTIEEQEGRSSRT